MEHVRRTWYVSLLVIGSFGVALSAVAADVSTLRAASAPAMEAARYLFGDGLLSVTSALALVGLLTGRSWAPSAMLAWMVALLVVVAWVLFIAVGRHGPPIGVRVGVWLACAVVSGVAVRRVRRVWASGARHAAA